MHIEPFDAADYLDDEQTVTEHLTAARDMRVRAMEI